MLEKKTTTWLKASATVIGFAGAALAFLGVEGAHRGNYLLFGIGIFTMLFMPAYLLHVARNSEHPDERDLIYGTVAIQLMSVFIILSMGITNAVSRVTALLVASLFLIISLTQLWFMHVEQNGESVMTGDEV